MSKESARRRRISCAIWLVVLAFAGSCQRSSPSRPQTITSPTQDSGNLVEARPVFQIPATRSAIGINLAPVKDHTSEMPFVNIFKMSREWIAQQEGKPFGEGPPLQLTPEGWVARLRPSQYATAVVVDTAGRLKGDYVCHYDGRGRIEFEGTVRVMESRPGMIRLEHVSAGDDETVLLHLRQTDPADPVRNIRIRPSEYANQDDSQPFFPPFLQRCRQFQVLRFMEWMETNQPYERTWARRPKITDATQGKQGVALEYMIQLSNAVEADPWFCMHHLADDDFIRAFARQVRDQLNPSARIYIEYSNEVWNTVFEQAGFAREEGLSRRLSNNEFQAQLLYYSQRSVEVFKIWEEEFGGTERLVRVLAGHVAVPSGCEEIMNHKQAYLQADAIAIAPYFGLELEDEASIRKAENMSVRQLLAACEDSIRENMDYIQEIKTMADRVGLPVIAYEGGQHLAAMFQTEGNHKLADLYVEANRSPRMRDLYRNYLEGWKDSGGQLFVAYRSMSYPGLWGCFGLLEGESQNPAKAAKYQAVLRFMKENPVWWR